MNCRICKSTDFTKFLDLGFTPPADDFLGPNRLGEPETHYPLEVMICNDCKLVQLGYVVPPEILFQRDYPYESSTTATGRNHYHALAKDVATRYGLTPSDLAVDIGSNVGVLLEGFKVLGVRVLGIDPAQRMCEIANRNGIETIHGFFSEALVREIARTKGTARAVTGTNVVAHIDDLHALVRGLQILLAEKGVFVFEAPYLTHLFENLEYDTIYHEHLSYLSVLPMQRLFSQFNMEIIDVQEVSIHGGTLRYHVARKGDYPVGRAVGNYVSDEEAKGIYTMEYLMKFAQSVRKHREELVWMLKTLKHDGKKIAGVSAPAKGMTLLGYCGIGNDTLDFLTEKAALKIGKFAPGTHIPVLPDAELMNRKPDYALLLAWNFAEEIMKNLDAYRQQGGKFIIPIPTPRIVG